MGHVGDELRFHPLAAHPLVHRRRHALGDVVQVLAVGFEVQHHPAGVHLIAQVPGGQSPAAQQQLPAHEGQSQHRQEQQELLKDPQERQQAPAPGEHAEQDPKALQDTEAQEHQHGLAHQGDVVKQSRQPMRCAPEAAAQGPKDRPAATAEQAEGHIDHCIPPPATQFEPQGQGHAPAGKDARQGGRTQYHSQHHANASKVGLHHQLDAQEQPQCHRRRQKVQWDPCPPAGTDAVHVRMVPGGTQQEDEADCHQQRRSSDDGVDPVAEGVGQFRQPVGQGVVVVINKHRGQRHCNPHGISVLNNAGAGPFRICPVIGKSELPRTIIFCKPRVPELPAGLILYHDVRDVPLRTVAVCCFRIHLVYLLFTVPDQEIEKRLPVSPGDIGKQLLLESRLAGDIDVGAVQKHRAQHTAGGNGGHHQHQQKGYDLGRRTLREPLFPFRCRRLHGLLLHHRLGDLLFDVLFDGLHVRIPFSSLYPWPQTTFKYLGSAGSISIFSRRWRM